MTAPRFTTLTSRVVPLPEADVSATPAAVPAGSPAVLLS